MNFFTNNIFAQTNYPVNLILTGTGRYSLKLAEYPNSSPSMINITMVVSDITIVNKPVKFQMAIINGNKKFTSRLNNIRHFYIDGGTSVNFTCSDLAEYFNQNNINFNGYDYSHIGNLPDGNNLLKVCLIDITTGKQISNVATLPLYASIIKAPELRNPKNEELYETEQVSNIINFKWYQHSVVTSPFNYRFELFEIPNNNISLFTITESIKPLFTETLPSSVKDYSFNVNSVNMKLGQKYAWRVVAFDENNILTFANNGKSEVYTFQYKSLPPPITNFTCKVVNNEFRFQWDPNQEHTSFEFRFKEANASNFNSPNEITENRYTLKSAKDDYKIVAEVRAICHNDKNRLTDWEECTAYIPKKQVHNYECGKVFPDREITNQELKTEFEEGEIIESKNGDTRFEMIKVTQNQNGVLSGAFYMIMDCWNGAKILCNFSDTKINTDNIMLEGEYVNEILPDYVADPEAIKKYIAETWLLGNSALTSTVIRDTLETSDFDLVYQDANGKLKGVVVKSDGTTDEFDLVTSKSPEQCLLTDGQGDSVVISSKGQPMGISEYRATGGNKAMLNDYHRKLDS
ncbi:MAG: hypothetical protein MJ211_16305, partial [Bacteroidales bacterium]|nr:hypothetical protein [Bacteroidales bacterium]